jgi:hypothetical protein
MQERMQRKADSKQKLKDAMEAGQHIIIDLDFDGEMNEDQVNPKPKFRGRIPTWVREKPEALGCREILGQPVLGPTFPSA